MSRRVTEKTQQSVAELFGAVAPPVEEEVAAPTGTFAPSGTFAPAAPPPVIDVPLGTFSVPAVESSGTFAVTAPEMVVIERRVPVPPLPPSPTGPWFYEVERYYGAFPGVTIDRPLQPGRRINFEEARRTLRNRIGDQPINFSAKPFLGGELSTLEEHRALSFDYPFDGGSWQRFVKMAVEMRAYMVSDPGDVLSTSCAKCLRTALTWCGMPSQGMEEDQLLFLELKHAGDPDMFRSGPWAALLDANIYLCPHDWGQEGAAIDLSLWIAAGVAPRPSLPVQNFIFDRGLTAGTPFAMVPEAEGVTVRMPLLQGVYEVENATYHSALGWKGSGTGGDTIGWRQLSMRPLLDQVLPDAA